MRGLLVTMGLAALVALPGCKDKPSAAENAKKIAQVEANQIPDAIPATPAPLEDQAVADRTDGCTFYDAAGAAAIAFAGKEFGFMKLDGSMDRFAPDVGSPETEVGLPSKYDGADASFTVQIHSREEKNGRPVGLLTITDGYDRTIYQKEGTFDCHGVAPDAG